jgi:hypothetical protein
MKEKLLNDPLVTKTKTQLRWAGNTIELLAVDNEREDAEQLKTLLEKIQEEAVRNLVELEKKYGKEEVLSGFFKKMKLIHYASNVVEFDPTREYIDKEDAILKPAGLWVSVEGEYDWKWWCEVEKFRIDRLKYAHEVRLKDDANILYLKSPSELMRFGEKYPNTDPKYAQLEKLMSMFLDWTRVKQDYQGVIIAPYQWDCRFELMWYYGWDCASGCIWSNCDQNS